MSECSIHFSVISYKFLNDFIHKKVFAQTGPQNWFVGVQRQHAETILKIFNYNFLHMYRVHIYSIRHRQRAVLKKYSVFKFPVNMALDRF